MAPFDLAASLGPVAYALVFGAIGFGFGAALEMGGFGDTRKLAGQFYFQDMTVLKVMFTGIVVAAVLVALATSFGLLDMSRVFVNPTYLWPGIVGGLIMGVGFVIGGFCPGTSLVAASTLKIDGMFFLLGALVGVWLFGETVGSFQGFWLSSYMGRFTLPEWLGLPLGVTVLLVVVMALVALLGGRARPAGLRPEEALGRGEAGPRARCLAFAGTLVAASLVLVVNGQPDSGGQVRPDGAGGAAVGGGARRSSSTRPRWSRSARTSACRSSSSTSATSATSTSSTSGARAAPRSPTWRRPERLKHLLDQPPTTVTFLVGNGEAAALAAWKHLTAQGVPNLYVIEGGVNRWLERYPVDACVAERVGKADGRDGQAWRFLYATGSTQPAAWPELRLLPVVPLALCGAGGRRRRTAAHHAGARLARPRLHEAGEAQVEGGGEGRLRVMPAPSR